jgi:hypothetical protein
MATAAASHPVHCWAEAVAVLSGAMEAASVRPTHQAMRSTRGIHQLVKAVAVFVGEEGISDH